MFENVEETQTTWKRENVTRIKGKRKKNVFYHVHVRRQQQTGTRLVRTRHSESTRRSMMTMTLMMTTITPVAEDDMKSLYASVTSITDRITSAGHCAAVHGARPEILDSAQSQI